jgi:arylsulfatase A-like enzyme
VGATLPVDAGEDSYSILPLLLQEKQTAFAREATIIGGSKGSLTVRQGDWKLIPFLGSGGFSKPAKIKPRPGEPVGQLYNLADDPGEKKNLYAEKPGIVERLTALCEKYKMEGRCRPAR